MANWDSDNDAFNRRQPLWWQHCLCNCGSYNFIWGASWIFHAHAVSAFAGWIPSCSICTYARNHLVYWWVWWSPSPTLWWKFDGTFQCHTHPRDFRAFTGCAEIPSRDNCHKGIHSHITNQACWPSRRWTIRVSCSCSVQLLSLSSAQILFLSCAVRCRQFTTSLSLELQQRSCEYLSLMDGQWEDILPHTLARMPVVDSTVRRKLPCITSVLLQRLILSI